MEVLVSKYYRHSGILQGFAAAQAHAYGGLNLVRHTAQNFGGVNPNPDAR